MSPPHQQSQHRSDLLSIKQTTDKDQMLSRLGRKRFFSSTTTTTKNPALTGLNCVITGASSGIGRASAQLLAQHGASCKLLARDKTALLETLASLPAQSGRAHSIVSADVADPSTWSADHWDASAVHVLVNAAGVAHSSLFLRTDPLTIDKVIDTNLKASVYAAQRLGKRMLGNDSKGCLGGSRGCIVNVASLLAVHAGRGASVYAASKAGLLGLTRALAAELGPLNVRTNVVMPGYISTRMTRGKFPILLYCHPLP